MEIRKTTLQDADTVLDVFAAAKRYMRANGNASQWGDEYPDRSIVTYDIACGSSYVMLENGEIVGTFALFLGEDESYRVIEDGTWHLDQPYGTIHRLASNGKARGGMPAAACGARGRRGQRGGTAGGGLRLVRGWPACVDVSRRGAVHSVYQEHHARKLRLSLRQRPETH